MIVIIILSRWVITMIRLNNKGYLTIEIILASVMAMTIAFFLIELTSNVVNKTDDYNRQTLFLTDKALIIKNIKSELEKDISNNGVVTNVSNCELTFSDNTTKQIGITDRQITYGSYSKKINDAIKGDITINKCEISSDYIVIQINVNDIFKGNSDDINIVVYNG